MKIIAFDPGTRKFGISMFDESDLIWVREIELGKLELNERLAIARKLIEEIIEPLKNIDYYAIETPFFGRNVATTIKLGIIRGIILSCIFRKHEKAKIIDVTPMDIRNCFGVKKNSDKESIHKQLRLEFGKKLDGSKEDALDSVAVGTAAMVKIKQSELNVKKQCKTNRR